MPTATDIDGTIASYVRDANVAKGSLTFNADGTYSFDPNGAFDALGLGDSELVSFTYHAVDDDSGVSATKTVTITVDGVNDAPVAANGSKTTGENTILHTTAPAATDVDGTVASYAVDTGVSKGALAFSTDGTYSFNLNGAFESLDTGESEQVSFTYHALDNHGAASAVRTVTITVTGANDPPVITSNGGGPAAAVAVGENTVIATKVTATDPDDTPTFGIVGGPDAALFTINAATGILSFKTGPDFENPADSDANNVYAVTVRASDGTASDAQAILITVTNQNGVDIAGGNGKDDVNDSTTAHGQALPTEEADIIAGKGGNDVLRGLGGNDELNGGSGRDRLFGDLGDDTLIGGKKKDILTGGEGADGFRFNTSLKLNVDKIADMQVGVDTIDLDDKIFKKLAALSGKLSAGALDPDAFVVGHKATARAEHIVYNDHRGELLYDKDGKGGKDAIVFARLDKNLDLDASDFLVI